MSMGMRRKSISNGHDFDAVSLWPRHLSGDFLEWGLFEWDFFEWSIFEWDFFEGFSTQI